MSEFIISPLSPADMRARCTDMAAIHGAAFGEPEEQVVRYRDENIPEMSLCPGLQCVATFRAEQMVGFVVGYDTTALPAWFDNMMRAVRETPVASFLADAWYLADIAVLPDARRGEVGTELHNRIMPLVAGRHCMLVTFHGDHPAKHFYRGLGWREVLPGLEYRPNAPLTSLMEYGP